MNDYVLDNKQIYDDYDSLVNKQKRNWTVRIYKILAASWFFIAATLLFIFAEKTLMSIDVFPDKSPLYFLNFSTTQFKELNFTTLLRLSLLMFLFVYPLSKIFTDLYLNKEKSHLYWPWFSVYSLTSISAFILFFTYTNINSAEIIKISFAFIPLFALDLSYALFSYLTKRKSDPLVFGNTKNLIITYIARALLLIIGITILFMWAKSSYSQNDGYVEMLHNNYFNDWFRNLFEIKKPTNLLLSIAIFVAVSLLLFFALWDKVILAISNKYDQGYFKNALLFNVIILASIVIWMFRLFGISANKISYLDPKLIYPINWAPVAFMIVPILTCTLYFILTFVRKINTKSLIVNTIILSLLCVINSGTFMFMMLNDVNTKVALVVMFMTVFCMSLMIGLYIYKNFSVSRLTLIFINLLVISSILMIAVLGANQVMLSHKNQSLNYINSALDLGQIFALSHFILALTFLSATIIRLWITLYRLAKNKTQREVK
ncbi:hypothetical protein MCFN_01000 [Mycoplasmopsis californica]|uniref:Uncharacterized protein n=1 Tax=Mycoplasmopsis californica TaxID=2113 RepID=A0A059XRE9_9BACT|nr:hypothetical protein [Mycoplasmopsis californica]AIA29358.1 hypothetical protein MCFN_01000 [Mycoplasmopsis californica]